MNAQIKTVYAVYSTDGSGYARGEPLAIYSLFAAAEASEENKNLKGYSVINRIQIVQFDDVNYILEKQVVKSSIFGFGKLGLPTKCYQSYLYQDGFDKSEYIIGDKELIDFLSDGKQRQLQMKYIISDDDNYFILKNDKDYKLTSFILTREFATQHALSKLTEEEKKLLGLI